MTQPPHQPSFWRWLGTEVVFDDEAKTHRARFLLRVLRFLLVCLVVAIGLSLMGPQNQASDVFLIDTPALVWTVGCIWMVRRGWVAAGGWVASLMFWGLVTAVLWLFGGLSSGNGGAYAASVMIAGAAVGKRAMVVLLLMSVASCSALLWAESVGYLPQPMGPITGFNIWLTVAATLVVVSLLHQMTVDNLDRALSRARESAQDHQRAAAALRQSQDENEARALAGIALSRLGERALSEPSLEKFYQIALESAHAIIDARALILLERAADGDHLKRAHAHNAPNLPPARLLPLAASPLAGLTETGRAVLLGIEPLSAWLQWPLDDQRDEAHPNRPCRAAAVPIPGRSQVLGYLCITCDLPFDHPLDKTSASFAVALCALIGSAMERAHTEAQLRQAQKMELVGRLTGGIAHDFNNVIMAIMGSSYTARQVLDQAPEIPHEALEALDSLDDATERVRLLSRQLLSLSRRQPIALTPQNLNAVIADLVPLLRRLISQTIRIEHHLREQIPTITADRSHLEQVVLNLCVNARDAMPEGGLLRIETDIDPQNNVILRVTDSGVGMDETTQRLIFQPFFTTKTTGTGLGLSTVSDIAKALHGRICVQSTPQQGTTFTLAFPSSGMVAGGGSASSSLASSSLAS